MEKFIQKHSDKISGILSSFDRIIFKGYLPFRYPEAMEGFLNYKRILIKDFQKFSKSQSEILKNHGKRIAGQNRRPYIYRNVKFRKEDYVHDIASKDRIKEGLICVLATVEQNPSFRMKYGEGKPCLVSCMPKCLTLYYYFIDPVFGFMHIRLQTWFPFMIQIYVNGHEWIAKKLDKMGIAYKKDENAFTWIDNFEKAQKIVNTFRKIKWQNQFDKYAQRVNPLMKTLLKEQKYYWVTDQAEYATDIVFKNRNDFKLLYEKLGQHVIVCFNAEDIMSFFDKKLHGNFRSDMTSDYKKRFMVTRIKHRVKGNWIKMYDKHGIMLRVETVINRPYDFRVRRKGKRKGKIVTGWYPMKKGVSNFFRYEQVCMTSNKHYLNALSAVDDPKENIAVIDSICNRATLNKNRRRALNPLSPKDFNLFTAVLRGENFIHGFRHIDFSKRLGVRFSKDFYERRRQSSRISRLLHLLRAHRLIAKIPRTRLYRITLLGVKVMSAVINIKETGGTLCYA